jgi:hypothetical protein
VRAFAAIVAVSLAFAACAPRHVARPGDTVRLRTDDGRIEGRLTEVTRDSVRVEWQGGLAALDHDAIDHVLVRREHPRVVRIFLGVLAAFTASSAIGQASRMEGRWDETSQVLELAVASSATAYFLHRALQDSVWERARWETDERR